MLGNHIKLIYGKYNLPTANYADSVNDNNNNYYYNTPYLARVAMIYM